MARPDTSELFDPAFIRSLEGLRMLARRVPAGGRLAEQRSRARGAGVEFTDVRPYVAGDDFRAVDWHLFQRLDKVFLRLFLEDEDLPVHVLLDESASMAQPPLGRGAQTGPRDKSIAARRAVAALAYIGAHHLDRVAVYPFTDAAATPLRAVSGRGAFHRLLAWLAARTTTGRTDLVRALRDFGHRRLRRGLCVIVSDFLDPRGAEAVVAALRTMPHELLLVRVVHPGEERPDLHGELEVVDCETGEAVPLFVDDAVLARYREAYEVFRVALADCAASRKGHYIEVRTDQPIVPQIATLFRGGVLEA